MATLHLCNTHGQLLLALCDVCVTTQPVTIIYLTDDIPLHADIQESLQNSFAHLTLFVCSDRAMMARFANLPPLLPDLIRRNLRWGHNRFHTAHHWQPDFLSGQQFDHAYVYNTGFFMAKSVAGIAQTVTLRESGLNNYITRPVSGLKRVLRLLSGRTPTAQILGEEPWVDHIAVARPQDLPAQVRAKGRAHTLRTSLARLTPAQKQTLLHCLSPDLPRIPDNTRTALLLTQPLDLAGMCDTTTKTQIYADIVTCLSAAGFQVFLKNHPRENPFTLAQTTLLDPITPIELWALSDQQGFDLGVALCSSFLADGADLLCANAIQLVSADQFYPAHFKEWHPDLINRLAARL